MAVVASYRLPPEEVEAALANQALMSPAQKEMVIYHPHLRWVAKRRKYISKYVRDEVRRRDGGRCIYCGEEKDNLHFDHRLPVSRGGEDTVDNLALACMDCNLAKSDLTDEEFIA